MGDAYSRTSTSAAPTYGYPDRLAKMLQGHGVDVEKVSVRNSGAGTIDFHLPFENSDRFRSSVYVGGDGLVREYTVRFPEIPVGTMGMGTLETLLTEVAAKAEKADHPYFVRVDEHHGKWAPHIETTIDDESERPSYREFGNFVGGLTEEYERIVLSSDLVEMGKYAEFM